MNCRDCNVVLVAAGDDLNQFLDTGLCIPCALRYRYCPFCGQFLLRGTMRNDQCRPCFRENPCLADYGTRVDTSTLERGVRYFGTEIETEVKDPSEENVKAKLREIDDLMGDAVIMKRDSSLQNGIEIVTIPMTLPKQYITWEKFLTKRPKGLISWDSPRCGQHIHVSRDALTEEIIAKAVCFVNSLSNKKFIYVVSGRKDNSYAKFKAKEIETAYRNSERHEAINLCNDKTVEFRMFKGTLKKESVFKNLEFVDALLDFVSQDGLTLNQALGRAGFMRFVKHQNKWPHLMAFIMCRWFGKETELSKQAGWKPFKNCSAKNELSLTFEE